jgi:hypothetical protein
MAGLPEVEDQYESESEDELNDSVADEVDPGKYEDPLKGGTKPTNLVTGYCTNWQPRHAWREFREFYQNWFVH